MKHLLNKTQTNENKNTIPTVPPSGVGGLHLNLKPLFLLLLQTLFLVQPTQGTDLSVATARNNIKTTVPLIATTDATLLNANNSLITVEYTDGLGNPCMTVQKAITYNTKKDLVSIQNYDCNGQVSNQWLPTPITSGTAIPDPAAVMQQAQSYYADAMPYSTVTRPTDMQSTSAAGDQRTELCTSGAAWHNGNKTQKQDMVVDDFTNPQLIIRQYGVVGDNVVLYNDRFGEYKANVVQTTDEDGHITYTFSDAFEHTLLQRTINNNLNHDTYYVYDDMGQLRFMLSPEASDRMAVAGTYSLVGINTVGNPLAQYGYAYKYDVKGRCIAKKLPGKDWNLMMYDLADHLIATQDGNQRTSNQWTYYKYDALDRLIQSGTATVTDAAGMQNAYNSATMVETYVANTGYSTSSTFNTYCTNNVLLTQNFYDSYDYLTIPAYSTIKSMLTYTEKVLSTSVRYGAKYSQIVDGVDIATQGVLTGTSVAMLDKSAEMVTALYSDDKGHVVQSLTRNDLKGYDREYYTYSFSGKILRKLQAHTTSFNVSSGGAMIYGFKYDFADRLTGIWHIGEYRTDSVRLCSIQYDELCRPSTKTLHAATTIIYGYNIHNQLKSISSPYFAENLYYQDGTGGKPTCFNGSIGSITWGTGTTQNKQYDFTYDGLNRLTQATYSPSGNYSEAIGTYDKNGNINTLNRRGCYNLAVTGGGIQEGSLIDALTNTYSGNQLLTSKDATPNQSLVLAKNDFKDDNNALGKEYLYDNNGNRIADSNKGIALIKYNLLNLPEKIYFMNGNKIEYQYDALGVKHKAKYTTAINSLQIPLGQSMENPLSNVLKKDSVEYSNGYIYTNRKLDKVLTPEGYIQTNGGSYNNWDYWKYCYNLKDYQGNTRVTLTSDYLINYNSPYSVSITASGAIDYYPFGMEITPPTGTNSGTNPYLYSGKEIDRMHGLNEYDFSARWQDAVNPGFTSFDPLAEQTPWDSPYAYCGGDPVNRVDPTGMGIHDVNPIPGVTCTPQGNYPTANDINASLWSNDHSNPNNGAPTMDGWSASGWVDPTGNRPSQSSKPVNTDQKLDITSKVVSSMSLAVEGSDKYWSNLSNSSKWSKSYKASKFLKSEGWNIKTSALKNGVPKVLEGAGRALNWASAVAVVGEVAMNKQVNASDVLNATVTGLSFIPGAGPIIGGGYFVADIITEGITGESIGDHLDSAVGGPLMDWK